MHSFDVRRNRHGRRSPLAAGRVAPCALLALMAVVAVLGQNGSWTTKQPMSGVRSCFGAATVGDTIWAVGGFDDVSPALAVLDQYDPATDTWASGPPPPTARRCAPVVSVDDQVCAIGGSSATHFLRSVECFDPAAGTWSALPDLPKGRTENAASTANGRIYLFSGVASCLPSDAAGTCDFADTRTFEFDPVLNQWNTKASAPIRVVRAAVELGGLIYVAGLEGFWAYDPVADFFVQKSFPPAMPVAIVGGASLGQKVFLAGGLTPGVSMQEYDPLLDSWTIRAPMPTPREFHAAAVWNSRMYTFGGSSFAGRHNTNEVFSLNESPAADAGGDRRVAAGPDCLATVVLDASGSSDPDMDALTYTWVGPFGTVEGSNPSVDLGLGLHTITLMVDDGHGGQDSDEMTVEVVDETAPVIALVTATPNVLWPPNHQLIRVSIAAQASDNCDAGPNCQIVSVASSEPENGLGDGDTAPDWILTGELSVELRAERSRTGTGRVYSITVECIDASGNRARKTTTVTVPPRRKK